MPRKTNPNRTYEQRRCGAVIHWRKRAQRAEADVAALRDELAAVREGRRRERAAAVAYAESAAWRRDLLVLARGEVRAELLRLGAERKRCGTCGGFGHGLMAGLLQPTIEALTTEHDLPRAPALPPPDWPVRMGRSIKDGKPLADDWLRSETRRGTGRKTDEAQRPRRPPHWHEATGGLSDG